MFRDIDYDKWRGRITRGARWAWRYRFLLAILWVIAVFGTEILLLKIPQTDAAYTIANSARFVSGNSDYLHRTFGTPTNNDIFTWSGWVKPSLTTSGTYAPLFDVNGSASTGDELTFDVSNDALEFWLAGALAADIKTSALFRDPAAWYHIVLVVDTTQAVASNRIKLYVNGVQITSLTTATYPSQNYTPHMNGSGGVHNLGYDPNSVNYLDGYMADVYFVDGQALTPSSFGQTDANGYWRPIQYTGTYGTNGFHLAFSNGSSLGTDSSGNGNNFTSSGFTAADQTLDSPTDSFSTFSPLQRDGAALTSGNLNGSALSVNQWADGTFCVPASGNWYWEIYPTTVSANAEVGISDTSIENGSTFTSQVAHVYSYIANIGDKRIAGTASAYGAAWTSGDIIGVQLSNGTLTFYKNGVSQGAATTGLSGVFCPWAGQPSSSASFSFSSNFGQMAYGTSTATANTNYPAAGGYFYYPPPSGAVGLSTSNLSTPAIAEPNKYFDAQTYAGSATQAASHTVTLTAGTSWTVPSDWNSSDNTITIYGGGAGGGGGGGGDGLNATHPTGGSGGGGGGSGYSTTINNFSTSTGAIISYSLGAGGSGGVGGSGSRGVGSSGTGGTGGGATTFDSGTYSASGGSPGGGGGGNNGGTTGGTGGAGGNNGTGGTAGSSISGAAGGAGGGGLGPDGSSYSYGGAGGSGGTANKNGSGSSGSTGSSGTSGYIVIIYVTPASGSQSITAFNFQPDLVWLKDRSAANSHGIFDSLEGATKYWSSNANSAEITDANSLTSFLVNGFSLGTTAAFNTSGDNYISWAWKKKPTTDGVDLETYTGTGSAQNISHNLGAAPDLIIVKRTDSTGDPAVYDDAISTPQNNYLLLDSTAAATADSTYWNNTAPTASVFTVGTNSNVNASGGSYVAYLLRAISGFSAFGSYTGNGSTDGPFVYTGFHPRFILFKNTSAVNEWYIYDTARDTYNPLATFLEPSENFADTATAFADALANGFKVRSSNSAFNGSGNTYIYAAFADEPFYYSAQSASAASSNAGTTFLIGMPY